MTDIEQKQLRIASLRAADTANDTFEHELREAGHEITVFTEIEPGFSFIDSSELDIVFFDPVSRFGMANSMRNLREKFDGMIVAIGDIPGDSVTELLPYFGITHFAANLEELQTLIREVQGLEPAEFEVLPVQPESSAKSQLSESPIPKIETSSVPKPARTAKKPRRWIRWFSIPSLKRPEPKPWHKKAFGAVIMATLVIALIIPFTRPMPTPEPVAKALPVVPRLLTEPLAPLTIEELSGDVLPLEISGIKDRTVVEKPAIAFWGDTAPDAFLTVNGQPVEISEYGAFVVDFPLKDGANFIEVLVSDFQGRTTSRSFTIVSLQ